MNHPAANAGAIISGGKGMGHWFGIPEPTMALATAPGGISEMRVTAKILKLGVPLVTAFQVIRLAFLPVTALRVLRFVQAVKIRFNS